MKMKKDMKIGIPSFILLSVIALLLIGCAPRIVLDPVVPNVVLNVPSSTVVAPVVTSPSGDSDLQYVQPTDYFYLEEPMVNEEWVYVKLGKLTQAPSTETKNQALFMNSASGKSEWAKWWAVTRIATRADLALGKEVIMFEGETVDGVYVGPKSTQEARNNSWFMGRITDVSELFKGYVMVSGGYKISEKNLRVIIK